jgi:chemotaxis response regulator CheB
MVRVFVCDDSEWFSDLVAAYIEPHADLQFVGSADERHVAFERLTAARPDVVLLDTMTYGLEPIRADEVRAAAPGARVLICSG